AVVEVKSDLASDELADAVMKVRSVRDLVAEHSQRVPFGSVFAYTSKRSPTACGKQLSKINASLEGRQTTDIVCVIEPGILLTYEDSTGNSPGLIQLYPYSSRKVWCFGTEAPLGAFLLLLQNALSGAALQPFPYQDYFPPHSMGLLHAWHE